MAKSDKASVFGFICRSFLIRGERQTLNCFDLNVSDLNFMSQPTKDKPSIKRCTVVELLGARVVVNDETNKMPKKRP